MPIAAAESSVRLSPAWCFRQSLKGMRDAGARAVLRGVLTATAGGIRVEGASRLGEIPDPAIFALSHHNTFEAFFAPAALIALRDGRAVRFLADWMYLELPLAGSLLRLGGAIPVYRKGARWRWRESIRKQGLAGASAIDRALVVLSRRTSIGIYPEGRRNSDPWRLAPVRLGAAVLAVRSGAPLVPIGIEFPARERLGRLPLMGRMILRIGEPLLPGAPGAVTGGLEPGERPAEGWADRAQVDALSRELGFVLAQLARKSTSPRRHP
jgi:1-acyl-sn-glycerol-3-phosphate acyltransferase